MCVTWIYVLPKCQTRILRYVRSISLESVRNSVFIGLTLMIRSCSLIRYQAWHCNHDTREEECKKPFVLSCILCLSSISTPVILHRKTEREREKSYHSRPNFNLPICQCPVISSSFSTSLENGSPSNLARFQDKATTLAHLCLSPLPGRSGISHTRASHQWCMCVCVCLFVSLALFEERRCLCRCQEMAGRQS